MGNVCCHIQTVGMKYFSDDIQDDALKRYGKSYLLLGALELILRKKMTVALSNFTEEKGYTTWREWFESSDTKSPYSLRAINQAKSQGLRDNVSIESQLPLSFWRYLLISKHYSNLWLPTLHLVFPELETPKARNSFHSISEKMGKALDLRNRVAHYNFYRISIIDAEETNLRSIISVMGEELVETEAGIES